MPQVYRNFWPHSYRLLCIYGPCSYGTCSYGTYSYGTYSGGLYRYGNPWPCRRYVAISSHIVMAYYIFMAHVVMAHTVVAYIVMAVRGHAAGLLQFLATCVYARTCEDADVARSLF